LRYVLGIDAGGTKTIGLLADEQGQVLDQARGGGANLQTDGELAVEKVFHEVIERLSERGRIEAVCLGIAGVDRPRDEAVVKGILRRLGHRERVRVVNDAVIALVAGSAERFGIVVLAGTGSIVHGLARDGRSARAGGYGYLLADEGSAYWLGHQALRAAVRSGDGRGPRTALAGLIFAELGIASVDELLPLVYEKGMPKYRIAALAPIVERARAGGDAVAKAILDEGARELALSARTVAAAVGLGADPFPVVLAGGVFKASPALPELLLRHLGLPKAQLRLLEAEPATGAVALALDMLHGAA
jgi:N-acetylglucosamine kinase